MSYATQLTVPVLQSGYGETFLVLWILLSTGRIVAGGRMEASPVFVKFAGFWAFMALALGLGTIVGHLTGVLYLSPLLHDLAAYLLLASVTCLAAAEPDAGRHLRDCAWWVVAIANVGLAIQVGLGWGWISQSGVNPWYWDRFCGWSDNPNQLALYCALFGPLALHLATTATKPWGKFLGLCGLILPFYVGRLTKSDTYLYTTILTGLMFLGLRVRTWLKTGDGTPSLSRQIGLLFIIGLLPLAVTVTPYILPEFSSAEAFAKSLTKDKGGQATEDTMELRLFLWGEAVDKGLRSGSLGMGPGPHMKRPAVTNQQFLPRPFEAHSTFLDLYSQGGMIAVLALMWIIVSSAISAWRAKYDALLALLGSIVIFSTPHLIIRHPIVWFALMLCLFAGSQRTTAATRIPSDGLYVAKRASHRSRLLVSWPGKG
ncbi:polymerase [Mesorhizobium sp. dw_380]|uniref:O-antigen ligase family protein n=1 Tax=Mesorhizobium sp. dw_380 TaxID=2812001 RepID=UPI00203279ED|nr:polymerase [Mesorhizobium sp. dw_380]